ncbi:MAG: hypothetical protein A2145_03980 [candidate division Zixibacteria bacterium RBG_16_40_9]|nr:MAG: hypothetical protein A2145_03980 [candidate division Zixibacteria bacterium RBG_16_40_9]
MDKRITENLKTFFSYLVVIIIFLFLFKNLYVNWKQIPWQNIKFNYFFLLSSIILLFINFFLGSYSWFLIMRNMKEKLSFKKSMKIIAKSQLAKYIPGGIWQTLGRVYLMERENISKTKVLIGSLVEIQFVVFTALIFYFLIFFSGWRPKFLAQVYQDYKIISLILVLVLLVSFHPKFIKGLVGFLGRVFKMSTYEINLKWKDVFLLLGVFFSAWVIQGTAFFLLLNSIYKTPLNFFIAIVGSHIISWIMGFLVLFAPGGMGVREGVLAVLLKTFLPLPIALGISLLSRVWTVVCEVILALIVWKIK